MINQDKRQQQKNKQYYDARYNVRKSTLQEGDLVLCRQKQTHKSMPPYDPDPFRIIDKKGTVITAKRLDKIVKRNSSFFKKVPDQKNIEEWFKERIKQTCPKSDDLPDFERKVERTIKEPERK